MRAGEKSVLEKGGRANWGQAPWVIDFRGDERPVPDEVDFAVVGGGFTGLAAAAWLRHLAPSKRVALFEADRVGAGSSGRTGGMALAETAAGDLPGLGDVLKGLAKILSELQVDCELKLPGAFEIGRQPDDGARDVWKRSPISWSDSGNLRVTREVPGGSVNPGKMVSGLARAAKEGGAWIFENSNVEALHGSDPITLQVREKRVRAQRVLVATNATSLELSGLAGRAQPKFTLAVATEALSVKRVEQLGLGSGKPFYTVDLPYLWGRVFERNRVIFGSGLVHLNDWRELMTLDVAKGEAAELMSGLERRARGLHPALRGVRMSHRWGGPILIADKWQPVFAHHPVNKAVIVLGAYSGHGVAQSVYLGAWAAEAMAGKRELPHWETEKNSTQ